MGIRKIAESLGLPSLGIHADFVKLFINTEHVHDTSTFYAVQDISEIVLEFKKISLHSIRGSGVFMMENTQWMLSAKSKVYVEKLFNVAEVKTSIFKEIR